MEPKMLPHNLDAEQAILGCMLIDEKVPMTVVSELKEEDFYSETHKIIYKAMIEIYRKNLPIDFVTVTDELDKTGQLNEVGSVAYITDLTNSVPSSVNFKNYVELIKRDSMFRKLIYAGQKIIENSYTANDKVEALTFAEKTVFDISQNQETSHLVSSEKAINEVIEKFELIEKDKSALAGLKTGFYGLDLLTNGLQKSDLILLAARPGVGKTSFAMNIINNIALNGGKCAVFSLEMSAAQLMQRAICSTAMVPMSKALKGELNDKEWKLILEAKEKLSKAQIFIDDSALNTPMDILSKCRRIQREHGLDIVMVDYLQLMKAGIKTDNRQTEVAEISRNLKIAAKELNVPILCLSQLSRAVEGRKGNIPVLSDLRESGSIEQDADIVMFIHNPDMYLVEEGAIKQGIVDLIIAKHRSGALDTIKMKFISEYTTFVNLSRDSDSQSLEKQIPQENIKKEKIPTKLEKIEVSDEELSELDDIF
ncbi:MAG: replicative DNA helicase [Clostridiales bacterium]|nr:replicative DNA helicase [Clostridiales bacterium]